MPSTTNVQPTAKKKRDDRAHRRNAARDLRERARRDKITELNAIHSPLLRLPAEIRNMIFEQVFVEAEYTFDCDYYSCDRRPSADSPQHDIDPILVSRQMFAETALLPYELGSFRFWTPYDDIFTGNAELNETMRSFLEKRSNAQVKATATLLVWDAYAQEVNVGTGSDVAARIDCCKT